MLELLISTCMQKRDKDSTPPPGEPHEDTIRHEDAGQNKIRSTNTDTKNQQTDSTSMLEHAVVVSGPPKDNQTEDYQTHGRPRMTPRNAMRLSSDFVDVGTASEILGMAMFAGTERRNRHAIGPRVQGRSPVTGREHCTTVVVLLLYYHIINKSQ